MEKRIIETNYFSVVIVKSRSEFNLSLLVKAIENDELPNYLALDARIESCLSRRAFEDVMNYKFDILSAKIVRRSKYSITFRVASSGSHEIAFQQLNSAGFEFRAFYIDKKSKHYGAWKYNCSTSRILHPGFLAEFHPFVAKQFKEFGNCLFAANLDSMEQQNSAA